MYTSQRLNISFSEFPERVTVHFGLKDDPERAAFFERDIRTQSYLVRDDAGNYRFAHKSFMEFFVAQRLASQLLDMKSLKRAPQRGRLSDWSKWLLTEEIWDFCGGFLPKELRGKFWALVRMTQRLTSDQAGYMGSNAISILNRLGVKMSGRNFIEARLPGADLSNSNLVNSDFSRADLRYARLVNVQVTGTRLVEANLNGVTFGEVGEIDSVEFFPRSLAFICCDRSGCVHIWEHDKLEGTTIRLGEDEFYCIAVSPDSKYLAVAGKQGILWLREVPTSKLITVHQTTPAHINAISFSSDGSTLAVALKDGTVRALAIPTTARISTFLGHKHSVFDVAYHPTQGYLASCGWDGTVRIFDAQYGREVSRYELPELVDRPNRCFSLSWSPSGEQLAIGGQDAKVRVLEFDGKRLSLHTTLADHLRPVKSVHYHPTGLYLASGSDDCTVKMWDIEHQAVVHTFHGHRDWVRCVRFSFDGRLLISAGKDTTIRLWDTVSGKLVRTFQQHPRINWRILRQATGLTKEFIQQLASNDNVIYPSDLEEKYRSPRSVDQDAIRGDYPGVEKNPRK